MIPSMKAGNELRRFMRSKMGKATLVSITLMPLLYSALYLWSFWNPFGNLADLPVALVNSDRGAVVDGRAMNAGDEVARGMVDNESLDWHLVSRQDAIAGVRDGTYYFSVELPEDFSEAVTSPAGDAPRQATLQAVYNDRNGYLSTVIGENAMRVVLATVGERIGSQAVDKLLVGMLNAGMGVSMAADGAGQLADGADQLRDGLGELSDGSGRLADGLARNKEGTTTLVDGVGRLREGTGQLAEGTGQLRAEVTAATGSFAQLQDDAAALTGTVETAGAAAKAAHEGMRGVASGAEAAAGAQGASAERIRALADQLRGVNEPAVQNAVGELDRLADGFAATGLGPESPLLAEIRDAAKTTGDLDYQLNDPASPLQAGLGALSGNSDQIDRLVDGVTRLDEGATQLDDGAAQLADGARQLDDGAGQLLDGGNRLDEGLGTARDGSVRLADGARELATRLRDGAEQVPKWDPLQRQKLASVMGGPVGVHENNTAGDNTFGAGLAPLFFSMALHVGGLVIFLVLRPLQQRQIGAGVSPLRAAVDGFVPGGIISFCQALAVVFITMAVTPLRPASVLAVLAFAILVALMYGAVNQMLHALLGPGPGRVTSLSFLMVQMVSSGGMYPVETQPQLLSWIHPFMPMTYAVSGFRQVMYGTYDARLGISIAAVLAVIAGSLAITAVAAARDRTWTMSRLHPPIDV